MLDVGCFLRALRAVKDVGSLIFPNKVISFPWKHRTEVLQPKTGRALFFCIIISTTYACLKVLRPAKPLLCSLR